MLSMTTPHHTLVAINSLLGAICFKHHSPEH